jgi:hypothetical protein
MNSLVSHSANFMQIATSAGWTAINKLKAILQEAQKTQVK